MTITPEQIAETVADLRRLLVSREKWRIGSRPWCKETDQIAAAAPGILDALEEAQRKALRRIMETKLVLTNATYETLARALWVPCPDCNMTGYIYEYGISLEKQPRTLCTSCSEGKVYPLLEPCRCSVPVGHDHGLVAVPYSFESLKAAGTKAGMRITIRPLGMRGEEEFHIQYREFDLYYPFNPTDDIAIAMVLVTGVQAALAAVEKRP